MNALVQVQIVEILDVLEDSCDLELTPAEKLACSINTQAALSKESGHTYAEMARLGPTSIAHREVDEAMRLEDGWTVFRHETELGALDRQFRGGGSEFCFSDYLEELSI